MVDPSDHVDERVSPDACGPQGPQVPGSGDGEVLLRRRLEQAGGLQAPGPRRCLTHCPPARPNTILPLGGQVAQLVEQRIENPRVGGSIPPLATNNSLNFNKILAVGKSPATAGYASGSVSTWHGSSAGSH